MMKGAFYFALKAFFVLKIFNFFSWLSGQVEKQLDQKDKVSFKFYDVTAWETSNCKIHIANISRSKVSQRLKFGQLIEYNMRNIFLETLYRKSGEETIPRPFSKKTKVNISLDQSFKVLYILFLLYAKLRAVNLYWN